MANNYIGYFKLIQQLLFRDDHYNHRCQDRLKINHDPGIRQ